MNMDNVDRLCHLSEQGDMSATYALARLCKRLGKLLPSYAIAALNEERQNVDRLFCSLGKAATCQTERAHYRAMSYEKRVAQLRDDVNSANGRRRERLIDFEDVVYHMGCLVEQPVGNCVAETGGSVANSYRYSASTTVVLAVRVPQGIVIAVGCGDAHSPTPGRVWKELQPWRPDLESHKKKVQVWAYQQLFFSLKQVRQLVENFT